MLCSDFEIRLCDYLDGTLEPAARRELEAHAAACTACGALLRESASLPAFLDLTPPVDAPAELAARILYRTQANRAAAVEALTGWRRWLQPLLAPRFVMGMAMTILSLSMLTRVANVQIRQLEPADLSPAAVWRGIDNRVQRAWSRGVKLYEEFRLFYEIVSQLRAAEAEAEAGAAGPPPDSRRIEPAKDPAPQR
jgi:hypothetical protein